MKRDWETPTRTDAFLTFVPRCYGRFALSYSVFRPFFATG